MRVLSDLIILNECAQLLATAMMVVEAEFACCVRSRYVCKYVCMLSLLYGVVVWVNGWVDRCQGGLAGLSYVHHAKCWPAPGQSGNQGRTTRCRPGPGKCSLTDEVGGESRGLRACRDRNTKRMVTKVWFGESLGCKVKRNKPWHVTRTPGFLWSTGV